MRRKLLGLALAGVTGLCVIGWHGVVKPLPAGLSVEGPARPAGDVRFLSDLTYVDSKGVRSVDQAIFDDIFKIISGARRRILLDLFLFNEYQGTPPEETRLLCGELTTALIQQKKSFPDIRIILITDPINTVYGGLPASHLERLRGQASPL